jgi:hypothetical protein
MSRGWVRLVTAAVFVAATALNAFAQASSTASISGVVVDSDGGVLPGADVIVKNVKTGETFPTVSTDRGVFSVPSLITGTYSVTVSLQGFKGVVIDNVILNSGVPVNVRATLELGGITETVTVQANSDLVQTQTATVATTLDTRQVQNMPLASRDASQFIVFLPGVSTPDTTRNSSVNGMPQSAINMTLDGVNIQDNTLKSTDGFFAIVGPRIDAIEEITVTTAAGGAEALGGGATQIRYTTRSGTNQLFGTVFHQYRSDSLNANTYFNKRDGLPKPELLQNQPGFNVGGPIVFPGFDGRNRAFFFFNYEELRQPSDLPRNRQVFHPDSMQGVFRYSSTGGGVTSVNLFELAARNGQLATPDPIIAKLFADVRSAMASEGSIRDLSDPLYQQYSRNVPTQGMNRYPTVRLDYQVSGRHRVTWSMNNQYFGGGPDTTNNREAYYPGFPVQANQSSIRRATSGSLRSTLGNTMVNEFRIGYGGAPVIFAEEQFSKSLWEGSVANQGGYYLNFANSMGFTTNAQNYMNAGPAGTTSSRDAYHRIFENNFNWLKGAHSITIGGNYMNYQLWNKGQQIVPELRFGVATGDPAEAMFQNAANFPGASATSITAARNLYAVLTGRVSDIRGIARLNETTGEYEFLGQGIQRARQRQIGLWAQDSWRMGANFTLSYGVRYDLTFPFVAENDSYTIGDYEDAFGVSGLGNIFKPGTLTGSYPEFDQLKEGERVYPMDWNNVAPTVGMAWTPTVNGGWLRRLTGETGNLSVRAGYSRSYTRLGLADFTNEAAANPGVALNVFREQGLGNLGTLPLLLREPGRLGPASFPQTPTYPMRDVVTEDINVFSPELTVPYADTWQAGVTRALGTNMSIEARYVGARSKDSWRTNNYNEINIIENGFLDEFKLAMANLQANNAAGGTRAGSFAYFGPGTGTAPLPTFLAYFNGIGRDRAGESALYTSNQFRSATYLPTLARFNPDPYAAATALGGTNSVLAERNNAINAGLPVNFFLVNPHLIGGADVVENTNSTMYHSMVLEFRRRASRGLQYSGSYVFGHGDESLYLSKRIDPIMVRNGGTVGDITHAFKFGAVYSLPFGRGERWGGSVNGVVDRIIGGWQFAGSARVSSGRLLDLGNVRLVGMDRSDLQDVFKVRTNAAGQVFMFPQEIIDESFKAFSVSGTSASGYGNLGPPSGRYIAPADSLDCIERIRGEGNCGLQSVILTGPMIKQFDLGVSKRIDIVGRVYAEIRLDALNVFNVVNFIPVTGMTIPQVAGATTNRTTGAAQSAYEVTQLLGGNQARIVQLVSRIRW